MAANDENENCHEYYCSNVATYPDRWSNSAGDDLKGEIIPLLARSNFSDDIQYNALKPSLRLLSRLLKSDPVALYLTTMIDGRLVDYKNEEIILAGFRTIPPEKDWPAGWNGTHDLAAVIPTSYTVTPDTRKRGEEILGTLSSMITFDIITDPNDERLTKELKDCHGFCCSSDDPLPTDLPPEYQFGTASKITMCPSGPYDELVELTEQRKKNGADFRQKHELLIARFKVAALLLHEIGHSVDWARFNALRGYEVFWDGNELNEAGYTLEALVFGGRIDCSSGSSSWAPWHIPGACADAKSSDIMPLHFRTPWPSESTFRSYINSGLPMASYRNFSEYETIGRVPTSYIKKLFTTEFWDVAVEKEGLKAPVIGEWTFQSEREHPDPAKRDPDGTKPLLPCTYDEVVAMIGAEEAHKLCSCTGGFYCSKTPSPPQTTVKTYAEGDWAASGGW